MPEIQAFRAIRYDLGHVGSLGDVVAPPYDVISPELQDALYERHPCNAVRLILNRIEPGDDDEVNNRYTRARRFLKNWQREGVLFTEADPAIYVYHQEFDYGGVHATRRGFMARVLATRFGEGPVFPHEETMSGPKADRLMLTALCKANLSQIFGLYPDPECEAQTILEQAIVGQTPLVATDADGVVNRMWPVTDVEVISALTGVMGPKPMFIADGHHRYETACNYREQIYQSGFLSPDHPANFVLMQCVAMEDPGLAVLPTHRLFRGLPELSGEELAAKLGDCFDVRPAGNGPEAAGEVWEEIETADDQSTLGLYAAKDQRWLLATLADPGRIRMDEVAKDHNEEWRELGVSILHRLVVEDLLGARDLPKPKYVHLVDEVVTGCGTGEFPLAALVMPATVADVKKISLAGERMPAKSTYFYPKRLSGLVFNPLE
jgi:uncharacterized protein (DUF1015 family)